MDDLYLENQDFEAVIPSVTPIQGPQYHGDSLDLENSASWSIHPSAELDFLDDFGSVDHLPIPNVYPHINTSTSEDQQRVSQSSMGPPTRTRKRKAPTLRAADWEPYKARIIELHVDQTPSVPLKEVKDIMEREFGFVAEIRQYRTRISQWRLDKNIKPQEMKAIVRIQQDRKIIETDKKPLHFGIRGSSVEPVKITRWMKRNNVPESMLYHPSPAADTPSAISYYTQSSAPSPVDSASTQNISIGSTMSMPRTPQSFSPASSIGDILEPMSSSFVGQSPAPMHSRVLTAFTSLGPSDYQSRETKEAQLRQKLSEPAVWNHQDTLKSLAKLLMFQGRYKSAEEISRKLVETAQEEDGNESEAMHDALDLLGEVFLREGLFYLSERLHRRTYAFRRKTHGMMHDATLQSMSNLARSYCEQGRLTEAENLASQVLTFRKRLHGDEYPDTVNGMKDLKVIYSRQGRYNEAEELSSEALKISKRVLGNEDPLTLIIMGSLVHSYLSQGRSNEAEGLMLEALDISRRVLGDEHPDTLTSMRHLTRIYDDQGRHGEAEEFASKICEISRRVLGNEHPGTLVNMVNLATTYAKQGRLKEAENLSTEAVEIKRRVLGHEHPLTLFSMVNLATIYRRQGRSTEADVLEMDVEAVKRKRGGKTWI